MLALSSGRGAQLCFERATSRSKRQVQHHNIFQFSLSAVDFHTFKTYFLKPEKEIPPPNVRTFCLQPGFLGHGWLAFSTSQLSQLKQAILTILTVEWSAANTAKNLEKNKQSDWIASSSKCILEEFMLKFYWHIFG